MVINNLFKTIKSWFNKPKETIYYHQCPQCSLESYVVLRTNQDIRYRCPNCLKWFITTVERNIYSDTARLKVINYGN